MIRFAKGNRTVSVWPAAMGKSPFFSSIMSKYPLSVLEEESYDKGRFREYIFTKREV